ncbi:MAG: hypothetical protein GX769_01150 [Erysipelothrix sp.]|nr:hypothetical protein [Erysipelothrix sp.]
MKINDRVVLNSSCELRVFYYNNDPKLLDHDLEVPELGSQYTIMGYVPEKSNKLRKDEDSGDFENYAYVIRNDRSAELFRVSRSKMLENFVLAE